MDVREKLVELLTGHSIDTQQDVEYVADYLISNGVTVQESNCPYCCDNGEGHGMLKHSYDDEDGMEMSIHPSTRKENGCQSQAWWATVHFRGECRDFYIEVCPFCGRRLVPLKEERETAMPQHDGIQFRTVDDLGRICIPKDIRDKLGIKPGTECAVYSTDELTPDEIIVIRRNKNDKH